MLISKAYAAAVDAASSATAPVVTANTPEAPSAMESFAANMGLILILVVMFYVLLILPQQRRFKEHTKMLAGLNKGDKVVTGGGFVGTIEKIVNDHEVIVDLGNGVKVTALRATLQGRNDILKKPANDQKK